MPIKSILMYVESLVGGSGVVAGMDSPGRITTVNLKPVPVAKGSDTDRPGTGASGSGFPIVLTPEAVAKFGLKPDDVFSVDLNVVDAATALAAIASVKAAAEGK